MRILTSMAFGIAVLWIGSIVWAAEYCFVHGCSGANGNNIDGFLAAFALAPLGVPALVWSLVVVIRWALGKSSKAPRS